MKILLDENIPAKVKFDFGKKYEVSTVKDLGWNGKKNGELLQLMNSEGFDFFITLDKNIRHQQNLNNYDVNIVLLLTKDNRHQTLFPFVEKIKELLSKGITEKFNSIS